MGCAFFFEQQAVTGAGYGPAHGANLGNRHPFLEVVRAIQQLNLAKQFLAGLLAVDDTARPDAVLAGELVQVIDVVF